MSRILQQASAASRRARVRSARRGATTPSRDDLALITAVGVGSERAFGELFDRYADRAYGVALSVCHDDGHAQDAVQEAFLALWSNCGSYTSERGTVAAWLLTVVRYRAIDVARRHGRHATRRDSDDQLAGRRAPDDVGESVAAIDERQRIGALLAALPDPQLEVLTLAFYGQLSHSEIAAHLGLPMGTVKGRIRLGLHGLRRGVDGTAAGSEHWTDEA